MYQPPSRMRCSLVLLLTFVSLIAASGATDAEQSALRQLLAADDRGALSTEAEAALKLTHSSDADVKAQAWYFVGAACLQLHDAKRAREIWQDAVVTTGTTLPTFARLHLRLGRLLIADGDVEAGIAELEDFIATHGTGIEAYNAAIAIGDAYVTMKYYRRGMSRYLWAKALQERELYSDADRKRIDLDALGQRLGDTGRKLQVAAEGEDAVLFKEAEALRRDLKWDEAISRYNAIFDNYPTSRFVPPSSWAIGECMRGQKHVTEAVRHWQLFIGRDEGGPWRGQALISLGDAALEDDGDFAKAATYYKKAFDLVSGAAAQNPGWSEAKFSILERSGLLAYLKGDVKTALVWFGACCQSVPPDASDNDGNTRSGMELLLSKLRNHNQITPTYVLENGDPSATPALLMADIYFESEDLLKAKILYQRIIEREGKLKSSRAQIGWARFRRARIENQQFHLEEAVRRYIEVADEYKGMPWCAEAEMWAAVTAVMTGQENQSISLYERLIKEYPNSDLYDRAIVYECTLLERASAWAKARDKYELLLRTRPNSTWVDAVRSDYLPNALKHIKDSQ